MSLNLGDLTSRFPTENVVAFPQPIVNEFFLKDGAPRHVAPLGREGRPAYTCRWHSPKSQATLGGGAS